MTVPTAIMRKTRISSRLLSFAPRSPTLPVQLTFCPVSSLSSQPRACRSSTNGWVQLPAGRGHGSERLGSTPSRARHAHARALAPPAPPESRFPTRDLAPLFPDRARALGVSRHRPAPKLAEAHRPLQVQASALSSFDLSKPAKPSARFVFRQPASRLCLANTNDRRKHTLYALSRRACAFVRDSRILKDRALGLYLRRALLPAPHAER